MWMSLLLLLRAALCMFIAPSAELPSVAVHVLSCVAEQHELGTASGRAVKLATHL